jgi:hypothetical protein
MKSFPQMASRAAFSIVCEPQPFSDPAQDDWIHRGRHVNQMEQQQSAIASCA